MKFQSKKIREDLSTMAKKEPKKSEKDVSDAEIKAIFEGAESIIKEELIKKEKKLKLLHQDEMIKKAGEPIEIEESIPTPEISAAEIAKKFNFLIDLFLLALNHYIKKHDIDPLTTEEITPLLESLAAMVSPKLAEVSDKFMEKIETVEILEKLYYFIKALYDIISPRYISIKNALKSKKDEAI